MVRQPILEIRAEPVREVTSALHQGRCVAILAPEVSGSSGVLQLVSDELSRPESPYVVANLTLPKGSVLPVGDFFRSLTRHLIRRLRTAAPDLDVRHLMGELYGEAGQSLLPDSQSPALLFEEVLAVIVDEVLAPKGQKLILVADHLGRVSQEHLREFGNIVHRLWEELDGNLVLLTAGSEALYSLCRRGSGDGYFSAFHIAHRVELEDLDPAATESLIKERDRSGKFGLTDRPDFSQLVARIVDLSGGHPHFVDRLVEIVAQMDVGKWLTMSDLDIFRLLAAEDDHLEMCRERILNTPRMDRASLLVHLEQATSAAPLSYLDRNKAIETLRWLGVIAAIDGHWRPRNRLYELFIERLTTSARSEVAKIPTVPTIDDTAADDLAGSQTVDLFDNRYQLVRQISTGSFGTIFEAEDLLLRTTVALKRLHSHLSTDKVSERFRREEISRIASTMKLALDALLRCCLCWPSSAMAFRRSTTSVLCIATSNQRMHFWTTKPTSSLLTSESPLLLTWPDLRGSEPLALLFTCRQNRRPATRSRSPVTSMPSESCSTRSTPERRPFSRPTFGKS